MMNDTKLHTWYARKHYNFLHVYREVFVVNFLIIGLVAASSNSRLLDVLIPFNAANATAQYDHCHGYADHAWCMFRSLHRV